MPELLLKKKETKQRSSRLRDLLSGRVRNAVKMHYYEAYEEPGVGHYDGGACAGVFHVCRYAMHTMLLPICNENHALARTEGGFKAEGRGSNRVGEEIVHKGEEIVSGPFEATERALCCPARLVSRR
jgi:hypothetical protein